MRFRAMTAADIAACAAIEATVQDAWSAGVIAATLAAPTARCFVAENGEVCAFCAWSCVLDTANLDALSVKADARRQGIGRGLLEYAIAQLRAQGVCVLQLEVRSRNDAARNLYVRMGFAPNGRRKDFYSAPADDAILMEKTL